MGQKIEYVIAWLGKVMISGAIALMICSVFVLGEKYSGIHVRNDSGATDYKWQPYQWKATTEEGCAWFRMDAYGFNNAYEPVGAQVDILLMGSSQMEAVHVGEKENTGYLLNELLPEYTYNIGISGHPIYRCTKNIAAAVKEYQPTEYVVMETMTVDLDEEKMQEVLNGTYKTTPSYDSGILYILQKSVPALKTIYKQAKYWMTKGEGEDDTIGTYSDGLESYRTSLQDFLAMANAPVVESGAKLVIFYIPSANTTDLGDYTGSTDCGALEVFKEACEANGILFVDMTEPFERLYSEQYRLAYGFSNTPAGEGHLNKYGHQVIAETLAQVIRADRGELMEGKQ